MFDKYTYFSRTLKYLEGSESIVALLAFVLIFICLFLVPFIFHIADILPEAAWGADPLEYYGGFSNLNEQSHPIVPSSVGPKGEARWSVVSAKLVASKTLSPANESSTVSLRVSFPQVEWPFLQRIYGWSATQWQGWARGSIRVNPLPTVDRLSGVSAGPVPILLYSEHVLELIVDGVRYYGGDFFAYRRAPLLLQLEPGEHLLEVRLVRDVRSMGGLDNDPAVEVILEGRLARQELEVQNESLLVSDVVEGMFAGEAASVGVTNTGSGDLIVTGLTALDVSQLVFMAPLLASCLHSIFEWLDH
jgi:hypothetical protein